MGRETRNFRQSAKARSGDQGARQYNQVNRGAWHTRLINFIKVRGKGGINGQG